MKKIWKFLPLLASFAGIVPAIALTSCSTKSENILREFDLSNPKLDKSAIKTINDVKPSDLALYDLMMGGKNIHHGNYIVILASQMSNASNKFLCSAGDPDLGYFDYFDNKDQPSVFNDEILTNIVNAAHRQSDKDFGIYLAMDIEPKDLYEHNRPGPLEEPYAYDYKWTDSDIDRIGKLDDDMKEKYKDQVGKYARNDTYATQMRDFISTATSIFTADKFKVSDSGSMPFAMVWKDGVPRIEKHFHKIDLARNDADNNLEAYINFLLKDDEKK